MLCEVLVQAALFFPFHPEELSWRFPSRINVVALFFYLHHLEIHHDDGVVQEVYHATKMLFGSWFEACRDRRRTQDLRVGCGPVDRLRMTTWCPLIILWSLLSILYVSNLTHKRTTYLLYAKDSACKMAKHEIRSNVQGPGLRWNIPYWVGEGPELLMRCWRRFFACYEPAP